MKNTGKIFLSALVFLLLGTIDLFAQQGPPPGGPPRGRGPGGFDPSEMVLREKQNVYKAIDDLSDDQKLLLDGIYDEFVLSFKELRDEMMQSRDFQAMRPKMEALRDEKDQLIKDVLNEDQFAIYQGIMENRRNQMRNNMQRRREQGTPTQGSDNSDDTSSQ